MLKYLVGMIYIHSLNPTLIQVFCIQLALEISYSLSFLEI